MKKVLAVSCLLSIGLGVLTAVLVRDINKSDAIQTMENKKKKTKKEQARIKSPQPSKIQKIKPTSVEVDKAKKTVAEIQSNLQNILDNSPQRLTHVDRFRILNMLTGVSDKDLTGIIEKFTPTRTVSMIYAHEYYTETSNMDMYSCMMKALAKSNPQMALEMALAIPDSLSLLSVTQRSKVIDPLKEVAIFTAIDSSAAQDPLATLQFYKKNIGNGLRSSNKLIESIFSHLARVSPDQVYIEYKNLNAHTETAIATIAKSKQTDDQYTDLLNNMAEDGKNSDIETHLLRLEHKQDVVADWVYEQSDDKNQTVTHIIKSKPLWPGMIDWLSSKEEGVTDLHWSQLASSNAYGNPKSASEMTSKIKDEESRKQATEKLARDWLQWDKQDNIDIYLNKDDLSNELRQQIEDKLNSQK